MRKLITLFIVLYFLTPACTNEQAEWPEEPATLTRCDSLRPNAFSEGTALDVSFSQDIQPLLETYCYFPNGDNSCHIAGFPSGNFETFIGVDERLAAIENRVLSIGDMPPTYSTEGPIKLDSCDLVLLTVWIDEGGLNN